jgi:hypothetical protein
MSPDERLACSAGAWAVVSVVAKKEGLALWRQRYDAGHLCHDERSLDVRA